MGKFESYPSINSLSDDDITLYNHDTVTHKINFARLAQLIKTKVSETIPIQGSDNLVTSGGIYNAIKASADSKADKATTLEGYGITNAYSMVESDIRFVPKYSINSSGWDNTPTENSTNPVISGGVYTSVSNVQSQLQTTETTPTEFYFDYQGGKYGWNSSSARGADTFHPFKQPATQTKVITTKTTTDLGEDNEYRYIDTTGVANTNSETYKPTTRNVSIDMGASNSYRYVNTSEVPNTNSGTYTASSRGAALDMGASNSYRYVNTNSVPNTNSGTYTFASGDTGETKDMGASNSYRYVNATNVYSKGVSDGKASVQVWHKEAAAETATQVQSMDWQWPAPTGTIVGVYVNNARCASVGGTTQVQAWIENGYVKCQWRDLDGTGKIWGWGRADVYVVYY